MEKDLWTTNIYCGWWTSNFIYIRYIFCRWVPLCTQIKLEFIGLTMHTINIYCMNLIFLNAVKIKLFIPEKLTFEAAFFLPCYGWFIISTISCQHWCDPLHCHEHIFHFLSRIFVFHVTVHYLHSMPTKDFNLYMFVPWLKVCIIRPFR